MVTQRDRILSVTPEASETVANTAAQLVHMVTS